MIHTRVPESLDDEIKRKAGNLGVSVSNLVRDVLENTIGLVEDIVSDSTQIARAARGESIRPGRPQRRRDSGGGVVLGWQLALLNVNAVCDSCNAILAKGTQAAIGIVDEGPRPFRCEGCIQSTAPS